FANHVGATFMYSDIGMLLLGEVVARLGGAPLDVALHDYVMGPLALGATYRPLDNGVTTSVIAPTEVDETWRKRRVHGEVHDENAFGLGGIAGHAGLFARVDDIARFGAAWLRQDVPGLPAAMHATATSPQHTDETVQRGLGWHLNADGSAGSRFSARAFGHTGFTGTVLWADPERDLVVALLTNRVYYGRQNATFHPFYGTLNDTIADLIDGI
ncbi:MAG: serine hydrolase, partial [Chloroflexota bacterium]